MANYRNYKGVATRKANRAAQQAAYTMKRQFWVCIMCGASGVKEVYSQFIVHCNQMSPKIAEKSAIAREATDASRTDQH